MLCLVIVGGLLVVSVPANAASKSGNIQLKHNIQVEGKDVTLSAKVSYVIGDDEDNSVGTDNNEGESTEPPSAELQDYIVDLNWYLGYVGSDSNASFTEKLNVEGTNYSYSDIIYLGSAGSTITFTDNNTNSNGDVNFASAAAYVISSWKMVNGAWMLDAEGYNANGQEVSYNDNDGARTYTYTSLKDGECVRLCYRSGQLNSFTPSAYPEVKVHSTQQPLTQKAGICDVQWHAGYVGSSTNEFGYVNTICNTNVFAYTDVIELEKKGTKVTFTDTTSGSTTNNVYVVSFWRKNGSEWVIDFKKNNLSGRSGNILTSSSTGNVYTYISESDNECIRFCFRSGSLDNRPTIYISEASEVETLYANLWIENDKERAFYDSLKGKTFTVIGDSYLAGNGLDTSLVWPALLATKYDMEFNNYGVNGSTVSNSVSNPMVIRYAQMPDNDPDIVIIEGGRNDYNKSIPLGTLGSTDTTTFKGAAKYLITKLQEKYPNAVIICLTVWEVGGGPNKEGNYCSDYGTALMEVCQSMNVPCINAMDQDATGVRMTDPEFRKAYCMSATDISHLNAEGMKLVFPAFEKFIADIYEKQTAN